MIFANHNPQSWIKMCRSLFDKLGNEFDETEQCATYKLWNLHGTANKTKKDWVSYLPKLETETP